MNVGDCMKRNVIFISVNESIRSAVLLLNYHHIGTLPVVDEMKLVGLIDLRDVLNLTMPDFVNLVQELSFIRNFGAFERYKPSSAILDLPVSKIMVKPYSVKITTGLLRAFAFFQEHRIYDIPVVDDGGILVGIASYVDVGTALMVNWDVSL